MIREAEKKDLNKLLYLYSFFDDVPIPKIDTKLKKTWDSIIADPNNHVVVALVDDKIVSSCVLIIVRNLTVNGRPYALIENVVTHERYRHKGYASACLDYAKELALSENCYKIMLMTGHKEEHVLSLYRKAGYNSEDKTAFIQWML